MSSLVFYTDANNIVVATDTLAVTPTGAPFMFSSKAIYLPHLRTIIAGTGAGSFAGDWAMYVNNRMILEGIENLNYHAAEGLKARWDEFKLRPEVPEDMTTTVYHFGFSEDNAVTAFAYRSTNRFASERLPKGFGIKPPSAVPEGDAILSILEQIVRKQRVEQDALPPGARIYIGGAVYCIHLTCDECKTVKLFDFDDQEAHQISMNARHARGE
ncbi:MAG: hypothetical protein ABI702_20385 [Burkholderiales bacterium]